MTVHRVLPSMLAALALALAFNAGGGATPAYADRCQPQELLPPQIQQMLPPPGPEENDPFCRVMLNYVYPLLVCDSTTLARCRETLDVPATIERIRNGGVRETYCMIIWNNTDCSHG